MLKKYLPWTIRILIFLVFMLSGIAKLFPVWAFEKQMVDLGITSWCNAPYLSRFIIALEISIAVLILQSHYIKRLVIPATVLLLFAFCVHLLIEMISHGAMSGNCGCFGQLIPMTPLEAFIKNIVSIGLLVYLYRNVSEKEKVENKFSRLLMVYLASALLLFVFFPFCPCKDTKIGKEASLAGVTLKSPVRVANDESGKKTSAADAGTAIGEDIPATENNQPISSGSGPARSKSIYSVYTKFGSQVVDLDVGKKIICLFTPGCDHCRETAREITNLSKKITLPPLFIFFMDEETEQIPQFFKEAHATYPYTILDVPVFWQLLGSSADTPGVVLLWNGNIIRYYEGLDNNKFNVTDFENALKSMD